MKTTGSASSLSEERIYLCPERLLCKSSNEKRSEICIREQFVTRMVRYGGEIENGDFGRERTRMLDFFEMYFYYEIKLLVS